MSAHVVHLPKSVWVLKIVQMVLSVLIFGLSVSSLFCALFSSHAFAVFTAVYSILILIFYFVAIHASHRLYNWIVLLVLECLTVVFWLSTWAVLAALYGLLVSSYYGYDGYYYYAKRGLHKRDIDIWTAYNAIFVITIVSSIIQCVLYCVTLGFLGSGIHRHRKADKPIKPSYNGTWPASDHEKSEAHSVIPVPAFSKSQLRSEPRSAISSEPIHPPIDDASGPQTHEIHGSNHYRDV